MSPALQSESRKNPTRHLRVSYAQRRVSAERRTESAGKCAIAMQTVRDHQRIFARKADAEWPDLCGPRVRPLKIGHSCPCGARAASGQTVRPLPNSSPNSSTRSDPNNDHDYVLDTDHRHIAGYRAPSGAFVNVIMSGVRWPSRRSDVPNPNGFDGWKRGAI